MACNTRCVPPLPPLYALTTSALDIATVLATVAAVLVAIAVIGSGWWTARGDRIYARSVGRQRALTHLLALAGVLSMSLSGCSGNGLVGGNAGPLRPPRPHGWSITLRSQSVFTDGFEVLRLKGAKAAKLESVELTGAKGLELVGFSVAAPGRNYAFVDYVPSWPPPDSGPFRGVQIQEGVGALLKPSTDPQDEGFELLLGLRVTARDGYGTREGLRISYRVGGKRFTLRWAAELAACAKASARVHGRCPTLT